MAFEIDGQLMARHQIHLPRQQKIIHSAHQSQPIRMSEQRALQAEIDIRPLLISTHGPRTKEPDSLKIGLRGKHPQQPPLGIVRNPGNGDSHGIGKRVAHNASSLKRCSNLLRSC